MAEGGAPYDPAMQPHPFRGFSDEHRYYGRAMKCITKTEEEN